VTVWVVATRSERWTVIAMAIGMSIAMVALVWIVGVVGIATASSSNVGCMEHVGTWGVVAERRCVSQGDTGRGLSHGTHW
jgi:hypothetical protein